MIGRGDKIASLEAVSAAAYSPMALGFGILDSFAILPKVNIDNKRFHSMDMTYIHELIEDLKNYQNHVRKLTASIDEIGRKAREEADCLNDLHDYFVDGIDDLKTRFICIFVFKYEFLTINRYRSFLDWFTFQNLFRLSFISHNLFITKHQYRKHKK